ncbi:hypothetical protein T439DRAFT_15220 [Meredithblackwellia eburnea MCA 4105]
MGVPGNHDGASPSTRPWLESSSPSPSISNHVIHSTSKPTPILDVVLLAAAGWALASQGALRWITLVLLVFWIKSKTSTVLYESILVISGLGLQLSTTRGCLLAFPLLGTSYKIPLSTSRRFVPLSSISDVVINEGIFRWKIIYYLVIIQDRGKGEIKLRVGFPELLPRLEEVKKVWIGIRHILFDELSD